LKNDRISSGHIAGFGMPELGRGFAVKGFEVTVKSGNA
jgi:hypothetical protein